MSRIGDEGVDDLPPKPPRLPGPVLRKNRRKPLHPEEIHDRLRQAAAARVARRGPTRYGWLVIVYTESGRVVRETREDATYEDARRLLASELSWTGPCDAWIVAKQVPNQRTVLP